jgi:hypothetical protein
MHPDITIVQRDLFVPHRPSRYSLTCPPLDFLPGILRPLYLTLLLIFLLLMLTALIFFAVWSRSHHGIWKYNEFGGPRYFVFQYLPTMIGIVLLIWIQSIETALQRIAPYMALASDSPKAKSAALFLPLQPTHFIFPKYQYFSAGLPLIGTCSLIFWCFIFSIPLLSSAVNVRYHFYVKYTDGEWRWIAVQGVIWTVVALYILVILAIVLLLFALRKKTTGLRWDPRSLADIVCLLERSNIVTDYAGSETFKTIKEFKERLSGRSDRLGYWQTTKRQNEIFYGLGEPGGPTRRYSVEQGRIREKAPEKGYPEGIRAGRNPGDFSIRMDIRSSRIRARYLPWYLKDTFVIAWVLIAVILLLAFLIISFVNNAVRDGFYPLVKVHVNRQGFSSANFLYSFVPAVIGIFLYLFWQSLDFTYRTLQPYAALSSPIGATAEQSLLLDYPFRLPVSVTVIAAANRHYRVALLSALSIINAAIPTLAGGVFWTQFYPGTHTIRVAAHLPGFYALCFFLTLYMVSIFVIIPGRRRLALPHGCNTLAETISFLYQSQIISDRAFSRPATKADLVTRLMGAEWADKSAFTRSLTNLVRPSKQNLDSNAAAGPSSGSKAEGQASGYGSSLPGNPNRQSVIDPGSIRYGFGVYVGRDGEEHLGIDRLRRGAGKDMVIQSERRRSWRSKV